MENLAGLVSQIQGLQANLNNKIVGGVAGDGALRVEMNGYQRVTKVVIKPEVIDGVDVEHLEGLMLEAFNNALDECKKMLRQELGNIAGINLPSVPGLF